MPFGEKAQEFFNRLEAAATREELLEVHDDFGAFIRGGGNLSASEMAALGSVFHQRQVAFRDPDLARTATPFVVPTPPPREGTS